MKAKMKNKNSYIYSYTRTAIGAFQGSLKSISATELGSKVIYSLINKIDLNDGLINEVIMGNVLSADLGQAPARQAALGAGLSNNIECLTINKVCGMENMSLAPYYMSKSRTGFGFGHQNITDSILKDGLWDPYNNTAMGNCAEILCKEESYSREKQDDFAIESYKRSNHAISEGLFESEITPIVIKHKKNEVIFKIDEEPLKFNEKKINQLRPAFNKEGTITAANASSLSDGAAAVLLGSKDLMESNKYKPIAKIIAHTSFATEPIYFTKAPIFAIKKVLNMADMKIEQIDLFEINEAFSCVPMVAIDSLNIPISKVNIHGGSVSMGHPIGASGTRILVTLINALKLKKLKYGIASICIGGGEASAMIIENCEIS